MSQLSDRIWFMWTRTDFTQKKIAELTGSAESYVQKVVGNYGGHNGWKKLGNKLERLNISKQVREAYFLYPSDSVYEIARRLNIDPKEVMEVCSKAGLPFRKVDND